ncbi:MAG: hypothetical protein KDA96_07615 [Planctomycetaceae bacterium]|nr:hypothetical protein [Planctomycetaceae bacterium]
MDNQTPQPRDCRRLLGKSQPTLRIVDLVLLSQSCSFCGANNVRTPTSISCCVVFIISLVSTAEADLIINIDSSNETLFFSGSVTATSNQDGRLGWTFAADANYPTGLFADNIIEGTNPGISLAGGTLNAFEGDRFLNAMTPGGPSVFILGIGRIAPQNSQVTLTGIPENIFSYASANSLTKTALADLASANTVMSLGTGSSPVGNVIIANASSVPEPSCATLLLVAGILSLFRWRLPRILNRRS